LSERKDGKGGTGKRPDDRVAGGMNNGPKPVPAPPVAEIGLLFPPAKAGERRIRPVNLPAQEKQDIHPLPG
jgi:hypothetical protein